MQPIIGYHERPHLEPGSALRRRPYFLAGAILSSLALFLMPNSSSLWMAAGLLWILDASINISMEPFRAFVADMQNSTQRPPGFAMQSLFIGLGTILGNYIASLDLAALFPSMAVGGRTSMHLAFYVCAAHLPRLGALHRDDDARVPARGRCVRGALAAAPWR